jgi:hypothetical protein
MAMCDDSLPKYFVLDGVEAYTTNSKPSHPYFEGKVKPKGYNSYITILSINPPQPPHHFTTSLSPKDIPAYKSNLQKCVRRGLSYEAIRTGYAMMSANTPDFLRRLPIVMLEDVLPHPSLIPLVWWMMASTKGYKLSDREVSYILGIIYTICYIDEFQVYNSGCPRGCNIYQERWDGLVQLQRDVMWALEFRKAYRGMQCDVEMIEYIQHKWVGRFIENPDNGVWSKLVNIPVETVVLYPTLEGCSKYDLILEAIDFHPYRWIPRKIGERFPEFTEYQIKGAIWYYRSRLNIRTVCEGSVPIRYVNELGPIYAAIEEEVDKLSQWIFDRIIGQS